MPQFADIVKLVKTAYLSMSNLINKSVLVAEIENLRKHYIEREDFDNGWNMALDKILYSLDTLEMKEVDIDKEINEHAGYMPQSEFYHDSEILENIEWAKNEFRYFFELGMCVNNPITAADRGMAEEIIINLKRVEQDYRINLTKEIEWIRNQAQKGEKV